MTLLFVARLLVQAASSVGISAGIDRMPQHVLQRFLVRPLPLEAALGGAGVHANRQLHMIGDQVSQDRSHRSLPLKLFKHYSNHRLNLFVGIEAHFSRRAPNITCRHEGDQFSPPRLLHGALVHALLKDV